MRIRHMGIVTKDLEKTATFYEKVFGFKRLGDVRTPGHYPGKALDLSDGEVNYSLLCPDERVETAPWAQGTLGPNHIGVEIADTAAVVDSLKDFGIEIYGEDKEQWPPRFFKFLDPDGVEIDVATPDRSWKF
ncbi:VOC family protein [Amycolatopsis sp. NPDC005232]|uniref:VOC family protein n=1 Tax=unclassified Amycolatopsis TaxID=2618356 RepID=UPI001C6A80A3|nr:VOC family protein [Amycolatopsis sp. DSM 110486]QYN20542.1 VOC family protein [Amycolatopsis sp. DSM 110486]